MVWSDNMTRFNKKIKDHYSEEFVQVQFPDDEINATSFEECRFSDCDLNGTRFKTCSFIDCTFENCNLSVTAFDFSRFSDVVFNDCKMIGINWTTVDWPTIIPASPIRFHNCILNDNTFVGLELRQIIIKNCIIHDGDFREGIFRGADFGGTDFSNSLFNNTDLTRADFTGAVNYCINLTTNTISHAKFSRVEAMNLLECLDIDLVD